MPDFSKLPMDIVYNILTYSNHVKERNGKLIFQIPKNDPRINMLVEKYRRDKLMDFPYDTSRFVVRFLNDNHYIRSGYATIRGISPNEPRFRPCIRITVVKFDRFKNGKIKEKSKVEKYSHLIMDTY